MSWRTAVGIQLVAVGAVFILFVVYAFAAGILKRFVQTYGGTVLGDSFSNYSVPDSDDQYIMPVGYFVIYEGNVWFNYSETWIGYYPGSGYTYMTSTGTGGGSTFLEWGGEVYSASPEHAWTTTCMGSCWFSVFQGSPPYAAWMDETQYMASWGDNISVTATVETNDGYDTNCYTTATNSSINTSYYGGPGWTSGGSCP